MYNKAIKERFYPTEQQRELLKHTFGCCRKIYNVILKWRLECYQKDKKYISYNETSAELTRLKKLDEYSYLNDVSSVALQQCIRHQDATFMAFFKKRAMFPNYKKAKSNQSISLPSSGFIIKNEKLFMAKCEEPLNVTKTRELPSNPKAIFVSKDCSNRYFVSHSCVFEPEKLSINDNKIGLDLGIKHLVISSDGKKIGNPKFFSKYEKKLKHLQRKFSKKLNNRKRIRTKETKSGLEFEQKCKFKNLEKSRLKLARIHTKISDSRKDVQHKISTKIIHDNQVICVESLNVRKMMMKSRIAKYLNDAGFSEILKQLKYKAQWYGREFVEVDRFFPTSKRCSNCGNLNNKLTLNIRKWNCNICNIVHDRDINAAKNILTAGLAELVCGAIGAGVETQVST